MSFAAVCAIILLIAVALLVGGVYSRTGSVNPRIESPATTDAAR